jgi:hypothetical protein
MRTRKRRKRCCQIPRNQRSHNSNCTINRVIMMMRTCQITTMTKKSLEMMTTSTITLMLVKAMEMMTLVLKMMVVCADIFRFVCCLTYLHHRWRIVLPQYIIYHCIPFEMNLNILISFTKQHQTM